MKSKKQIIIIENEGGRLANQLWNYISILAYAFEKNYDCKNYFFWQYYRYFRTRTGGSLFDLISFILPKRLNNFIFQLLIKQKKNKYPDAIIHSGNHINIDTLKPFYLPPTIDNNHALEKIERSENQEMLFSGWLFRNPVGILKHRKMIIDKFKPRKITARKVDDLINNLRQNYKHVIGVHIRKTDYKNYCNGIFYFEEKEVNTILLNCLKELKLISAETVFLICSDGYIDSSIFKDLNISIGIGGVAEDLFTLSKTDFILGSDSTFGAMSAYLGNIPIVFFDRNKMDYSPINKRRFNYYNNSLNIQL